MMQRQFERQNMAWLTDVEEELRTLKTQIEQEAKENKPEGSKPLAKVEALLAEVLLLRAHQTVQLS